MVHRLTTKHPEQLRPLDEESPRGKNGSSHQEQADDVLAKGLASALQPLHCSHEQLPEAILTHKCDIGAMQKLIDQLIVFDDPSFSKRDEQGKVSYHRGLCTTLISPSEQPFVKTYTNGVRKPLFGLILNHENMATLLASPTNMATLGHFHADRLIIGADGLPRYRGNKHIVPRADVSNYEGANNSLFHDTSRVMEKYHRDLKSLAKKKVEAHGRPLVIRGGKVVDQNEILVAQREGNEKTCLGVFVDLLSHDIMTKSPAENFLRKQLTAHFPTTKQGKKKDIFQRSFEKNMASLENYRNEFENLKAVCGNNSLRFYIRNLDANGKPQMQALSLSSISDFDEFLSACANPEPNVVAREKTMTAETKRTENAELAVNLSNANAIQLSSRNSILPRQEWVENLAQIVSRYFNKPYKYTTHKVIGGLTREIGDLLTNHKIMRKVGGVEYTVFRRQHGLAHGVRQSFLVADVVDACAAMKKGPSENPAIHNMIAWIKKKKENDPNFIKKLQFSAAFLRSGRESEANSASSSHSIYIQRDAENFLAAASTEGNPFDSDEERKLYAGAILGKAGEISFLHMNEGWRNVRNLSKLLRAAHTLDLRRIMHFDEDWIKKDAASHLFDDNAIKDGNVTKLVDKLWHRSGEYLAAVGDSDLTKQGGIKYKNISDAYQDKFFTLSNDPKQLVAALYEARNASTIVFGK